MSDITTFRAMVRNLTGLTNVDRGGADASLDNYITATADEWSLWVPKFSAQNQVITGGVRAFDANTLARFIQVRSIEYPVGLYPPVYLGYATVDDTIYLDHYPPATNYTINIRWQRRYLIDNASSDIQPEDEEAIALGAAALALTTRGLAAADAFQTSANAQPPTYQHLRLAQEMRLRYEALRRRRQRLDVGTLRIAPIG
jgi:hypothetical protein